MYAATIQVFINVVILNLNLCDKLKDEVFLYGLRIFSYFLAK